MYYGRKGNTVFWEKEHTYNDQGTSQRPQSEYRGDRRHSGQGRRQGFPYIRGYIIPCRAGADRRQPRGASVSCRVCLSTRLNDIRHDVSSGSREDSTPVLLMGKATICRSPSGARLRKKSPSAQRQAPPPLDERALTTPPPALLLRCI